MYIGKKGKKDPMEVCMGNVNKILPENEFSTNVVMARRGKKDPGKCMREQYERNISGKWIPYGSI